MRPTDTLTLLASISYAIHLLAEPATCYETLPSAVRVTESAQSTSTSCLSTEQFANTSSTNPTSAPRTAQTFTTILTRPSASSNTIDLGESLSPARAVSSTLQARAMAHKEKVSSKTVLTMTTNTAPGFSSLATQTAFALLSSTGVASSTSSADSRSLVQNALSLPIIAKSVSDSRSNVSSIDSAKLSNTVSVYTVASVFLYLMGVLMTAAELVALL